MRPRHHMIIPSGSTANKTSHVNDEVMEQTKGGSSNGGGGKHPQEKLGWRICESTKGSKLPRAVRRYMFISRKEHIWRNYFTK